MSDRLHSVTDVQLRLASESDKVAGLLAYCSVVFDDGLIIYDLKLVRGDGPDPFVAMPSRKLTTRHSCGHKNEFANRYCGGCGKGLQPQQQGKKHADVVHPITLGCRRAIHDAVMAAYHKATNST